MKTKKNRMEALKMLISSMELGSQEEVLQALEKEGFKLTQATLSRDLKQLKVAKAASSIAYNIDDNDIPGIMGTIAGDDTIFIVIKEGTAYEDVIDGLGVVIPNIK